MASFSLSNIGSTSVTFNVSGITYKTTENEDGTTETSNYVVVRFFIRLAADEDDKTIDYAEVLYGATSITMTFDGLEPLTEYAANVQTYTEDPNIDGAWIGAQYFTSGERATSSLGTLMELPLLSGSFPLFSWVDWPDSYAALYSGGYTANFEKECWNDIVDTLEAALHEAGFKWQNDYTTVSGAQISRSYGALYAEMFNSVRHNIDRLTLLGWDWAKEPTFYGYVGREDFNGVSTFGSAADEMYYTYLLELVRRLNVLINVLKGEVVKYISGSGQIRITYDETIRKGQSAPISYSRAFQLTDCDALIRAGRSGVIRPKDAYLRTSDSGNILPGRAGIVRSLTKVSAGSVLSANPDASRPVKSLTQVAGKSDATILAARPGWIFEDVALSTDSDALVRPGDGVPLIGTAEAEADGAALVLPDSSIPFAGSTGTEAEGEVYVRNPSSTLIEIKGDGAAAGETNILPEASIPVRTVTRVGTSADGGIRPDVGASAGGTGFVAMGTDVKVDIAWYPPVWLAPGELLIIQAWDETNLNNGVLEVI